MKKALKHVYLPIIMVASSLASCGNPISLVSSSSVFSSTVSSFSSSEVSSYRSSLDSASTSMDTRESEMQKIYGPNFHLENTVADKQYLFGMDHIAYPFFINNNLSYKTSSALFKNLGVKSVRNWMHFGSLLQNPTTYDEKGLAIQKDIVKDSLEKGFQVIGMSHVSFVIQEDGHYSITGAKPKRNLTENSFYLNWLKDYEQSWYMMTKAFPEITYWEIDNEDNNDGFFAKLDGGTFSLKEKADIYTDMMFFASKGIHRGNPHAVSVMGGLVTWGGPEKFVQFIYDNISSNTSWSPYPDDYFQVACWHPYLLNFDKDVFIQMNNNLYNVIKYNEGKDKKVFLTEAGFTTSAASMDDILNFIPSMYEACAVDLPYVESLHYYRPFDDYAEGGGSGTYYGFGLFTDPLNHADGQNPNLGAPKKSAYAYQKAAGGSGSLKILQNELI